MILDERIINTIARWLHLHDHEGDQDAANRAWGPELCDYADAYQSSYRRKARKLAYDLAEENERQQREAARQRQTGDGEVPEPLKDGS